MSACLIAQGAYHLNQTNIPQTDEDGLAGLEVDREERQQKAKDKRADVMVRGFYLAVSCMLVCIM